MNNADKASEYQKFLFGGILSTGAEAPGLLPTLMKALADKSIKGEDCVNNLFKSVPTPEGGTLGEDNTVQAVDNLLENYKNFVFE